MKLISLWEPWATLMALGVKRIETRSWRTPYRGWLAIQAAKHFTADEDDLCWTEPFLTALRNGGVKDVPYRAGRRFHFPLGCIVAVVNLVDCVRTEDFTANVFPCNPLYRPADFFSREQPFGNYDNGRYGWVTDQLFRLPEPIPFNGKQGLCDVPEELAGHLRRLMQQREAGSNIGRPEDGVRRDGGTA